SDIVSSASARFTGRGGYAAQCGSRLGCDPREMGSPTGAHTTRSFARSFGIPKGGPHPASPPDKPSAIHRNVSWDSGISHYCDVRRGRKYDKPPDDIQPHRTFWTN